MITSVFEAFKHYNILIIGDVMLDSYIWGQVDRISPEAPVPVVLCTKRENRLGGAGNVVINLKALGANPILCTIVGNDERQKILFDIFEQNQLTTKGILTSSERVTTVKTRIIGHHQQLLRVDDEINLPISSELETHFLTHIAQVLDNNKIDAIIFQDYDKGVITKRVIDEVVTMSQSKKIPTLVDPKKRNFSHFHHVTLFKPNFKELREGLKIDVEKGNFEQLFEAVKILHDSQNVENVMVTLSELGVFISNNQQFWRVPAEVRDIADVSGAGDTVISVAALCVVAGMEMPKIAAIANLAGGLVCEKVGVVPIDKQQLINEIINSGLMK